MKIIKDLLSEQIYKILKNDIINSKINFGEVLVNKNLQERFEVSSTPIRDAILRLKEDGIIEEITRSGANLINEILVKAYHKGAFSLEIRMACLKDHKNIIKSIEENNISKTLDSVKKHYLRADKLFKKNIKIN